MSQKVVFNNTKGYLSQIITTRGISSYLTGLYPFTQLTNRAALVMDDITMTQDSPSLVHQYLSQGTELAFLTGGFDLGIHHAFLFQRLKSHLPPHVLVSLGIESDSYIRSKGRQPNFNQVERLLIMASYLKQQDKLAFTFPILPCPENIPPDQYYKDIANMLGAFQNPGCYWLYNKVDQYYQQKRDRMVPPIPEWCEIPLIGNQNPISVSELASTIFV